MDFLPKSSRGFHLEVSSAAETEATKIANIEKSGCLKNYSYVEGEFFKKLYFKYSQNCYL
jgi:hypothetical protein